MNINNVPFPKKGKNILGQRFGNLEVIEYLGLTDANQAYWKCKCDCGNEINLITTVLTAGGRISCGCVGRELQKKAVTKHGLCYTNIYNIYQTIRKRCCDPANAQYEKYGGRGIRICAQWLDDDSSEEKSGFLNFYNWAIENGYTEDLMLDRIDPDRDFCPENCRWVSRKQRWNNNKNNHYITLNLGFKYYKYSVREWSRISGIPDGSIYSRLRFGWSDFDAIFTPVGGKPGRDVIIPVISQEMESLNHLSSSDSKDITDSHDIYVVIDI